MGRITLITTLLCTIACTSEPEGFDYDGPKLECDCDDGPMMILLYNSCITAHGKASAAKCFDVSCKTACPIEIDWDDFE